MFVIIIIQLFFLVVSYATAKYHAKLFKANKKFRHWPWALAYGVLAALPWIVFGKDMLLLSISLISLRFPFFNIMLNKFRNLPLYYIGKSTGRGSHASWQDRVMTKFYPLAFWIGIILFITLEFFILW